MDFITAREAGKRWGISGHVVTELCLKGRVEGATRMGEIWHVPVNAENPAHYKGYTAPGVITDPDLLTIIGVEKRLGNLPDESIDYWASIAKKFSYKTNEFFSSPEDPSCYLAYIAKGLFRGYLLDSSGNEATLWFAFENTFMEPFASVVMGKSNGLYMQALEDAVIYAVTLDEYMARREVDDAVKETAVMFEDMSFMQERERSVSLMTKDAYTRYAEFLKYHAEQGLDVSRIKDKYIASYLGIAPESLSRIKKKYSRT